MDKNLKYKDLLSMVHEIVSATRNSFVYEMKFLLNASGKTIKFKIKNDRDAQFVLEGAVGIIKCSTWTRGSRGKMVFSRNNP